MDTVNVNTDQPIKQDDVVILDDGTTATASVDEVVINSSESTETENETIEFLPTTHEETNIPSGVKEGAVVALGVALVEPTPIGELIVAGYVTYLTLKYGPDVTKDLLDSFAKGGGKDGLKGGKRNVRDRDYGIKDKDFWRWWHRKGKPKSGGKDIKSKGQADDVYNKWVNKGKPKVK